jgi:hypothetical protein
MFECISFDLEAESILFMRGLALFSDVAFIPIEFLNFLANLFIRLRFRAPI